MLIPYVLPHERVATSPERVKEGLLRGNPLEILQPAPQRVIPRCEYFANCGGCHYQHADYSFQLEQKQAILRETLQRLGGLAFDGEIQVLSGHPWNYRNRIQLHFKNGEAGFHKAGSHALCSIDHCYISSPLLVEVIQKLHRAAKEPPWPDFLRSLEVFTNGTDVQLSIMDSVRPVAARFFEWCGTFLPSLVSGAIEYQAAGTEISNQPWIFFSSEPVSDGWPCRGGPRRITGRPCCRSLCRSGALFPAIGAAVRQRRRGRARRTGASRLRVECRPVERQHPAGESVGRRVPARHEQAAGPDRGRSTASGIGKRCDRRTPAHQVSSSHAGQLRPGDVGARPEELIAEAYRIDRLTLVDLFPQTYHFEVVAHLAIQ